VRDYKDRDSWLGTMEGRRTVGHTEKNACLPHAATSEDTAKNTLESEK